MAEKKVREADIQKVRVRYFRRHHEAPRVLKFSMIRNHIVSNYTLVDGEEYELPIDVINHLHAIKEEVTYTSVDGKTRNFVNQYYVCEPVE